MKHEAPHVRGLGTLPEPLGNEVLITLEQDLAPPMMERSSLHVAVHREEALPESDKIVLPGDKLSRQLFRLILSRQVGTPPSWSETPSQDHHKAKAAPQRAQVV